ncbi:MAG: heavy metal translocating P-type ATPase [Eubacteriales bacterium]|nr:heavy metal translocating P-type ATPase [Eubacteriales bacterium]
MSKKQKRVLYRLILAAVLLVAASLLPVTGVWKFLCFLVPYFIIGYDVLLGALHGIVNGQIFDENFLMAIATVGAMGVGDYKESVAVLLFYQLGELFQSFAVGKSRQSITQLMDIHPEYANVTDENGQLAQVDPEEVEVGTEITVLPGERIPIDGVILTGTSTLNTSALTGESLPRSAVPGDAVISGCVNLDGVLVIQTTKLYEDSTVARILELTENSAMKKARAERFITRFAHYYTPIVCISALVLAILPPVIRLAMGFSGEWGTWIYRALTFLVISCPCALVISIPLTFFGGIGGASRHGILVKGANDLETLAGTRCMVFDKTGTLTQGVFSVTEVHPAEGWDKEQVLRLAALAEQFSNHPISRSIQEACTDDLTGVDVTDVQERGGHGITAQADGHTIAAGNQRLMDALNIAVPSDLNLNGTTVLVACDGVYVGVILVADQVKAGAKEALAKLKAVGVGKTVMLTGDGDAPAAAVAKELGVDEYHSKLLPADKVTLLEQLLEQERPVAFVGDGVNDAPVLTRADVGIAMGAMGSDAAIEAADVVLMEDDLRKLPLAMAIARKTLRIVRENIVFALAVKALCLVFSAVGIANMWWAIFADVGVMVLCVCNAIRALK